MGGFGGEKLILIPSWADGAFGKTETHPGEEPLTALIGELLAGIELHPTPGGAGDDDSSAVLDKFIENGDRFGAFVTERLSDYKGAALIDRGCQLIRASELQRCAERWVDGHVFEQTDRFSGLVQPG